MLNNVSCQMEDMGAPSAPRKVRTALYRHYDATGRLLYVGITDCLSERDKRHAATSHWHGEVHRTLTEWCLSRQHAIELEAVAVRHEKPLHNVALTIQPEVSDLLPSMSDLIRQIENHCARMNIPETSFGFAAIGDPNLMRDLRNGRELRSKTIAAIRSKMAEGQAA